MVQDKSSAAAVDRMSCAIARVTSTCEGALSCSEIDALIFKSLTRMISRQAVEALLC